jgi:hypothetical protein
VRWFGWQRPPTSVQKHANLSFESTAQHSEGVLVFYLESNHFNSRMNIVGPHPTHVVETSSGLGVVITKRSARATA